MDIQKFGKMIKNLAAGKRLQQTKMTKKDPFILRACIVDKIRSIRKSKNCIAKKYTGYDIL